MVGRDTDTDMDTDTATITASIKGLQLSITIVRLTKEVLDTILLMDEAAQYIPTTIQGARGEDEDDWTHISDKSRKDIIGFSNL